MNNKQITAFLERHFRHFNSAMLIDAAHAYRQHVENDGHMFLTIAGAMSTAELGISLSEMIRQGKVHAICCTGANLEEDIFNLIAHNCFERIPHYRNLTPADEKALLDRQMNRVTDTCIPEVEAIQKVEKIILAEWLEADRKNQRLFPHEFIFDILREGKLKEYYQIDIKNSWVYAAMERNLPIFVPGWEDSTLGNIYAAHCVTNAIKDVHTVRGGIEYMMKLVDFYISTTKKHPLGFFQIGGGIAGDFPICVVPLLRQDFQQKDIPLWSYYCQISDSTTSYGSYSGAVPNEKISWGKLGVDTPKFIIESDASIVVPLIFAVVLNL